jgi:hypothetical protein
VGAEGEGHHGDVRRRPHRSSARKFCVVTLTLTQISVVAVYHSNGEMDTDMFLQEYHGTIEWASRRC